MALLCGFRAFRTFSAVAGAVSRTSLLGAALFDGQGRIHAGCNVKNAAYPQGVCAEAGALSAMVLAGGTEVRAALVVGPGDALVTPYGDLRGFPQATVAGARCRPWQRATSGCW